MNAGVDGIGLEHSFVDVDAYIVLLPVAEPYIIKQLHTFSPLVLAMTMDCTHTLVQCLERRGSDFQLTAALPFNTQANPSSNQKPCMKQDISHVLELSLLSESAFSKVFGIFGLNQVYWIMVTIPSNATG